MSEQQPSEEINITGVGNAIKHVDEMQAKAAKAWADFSTHYEQFTKMKPNQPVTALDVYKIRYETWGEPKGD